MPPIVYAQTSEQVRVGDKVLIRRRFRKPLSGIVTHVYDPSKPSPPRGENDYGVAIQIGDNKYCCILGQPPENIQLLERG